MRVHVYPKTGGKHTILVVPPPAKRLAPTLLSADTREGVLQGLRDHLRVNPPEPVQTALQD